MMTLGTGAGRLSPTRQCLRTHTGYSGDTARSDLSCVSGTGTVLMPADSRQCFGTLGILPTRCRAPVAMATQRATAQSPTRHGACHDRNGSSRASQLTNTRLVSSTRYGFAGNFGAHLFAPRRNPAWTLSLLNTYHAGIGYTTTGASLLVGNGAGTVLSPTVLGQCSQPKVTSTVRSHQSLGDPTLYIPAPIGGA